MWIIARRPFASEFSVSENSTQRQKMDNKELWKEHSDHNTENGLKAAQEEVERSDAVAVISDRGDSVVD